jgi:lysophospholipid acyltransferase (LPLAT)-like uncharacterized protein
VKEAKFTAAGLLGQGLLGSLFTTTRSTRVGQEHYLRFRREGRPVVFVFWHGQLLPLVHYHRSEGIVVLVSEHADGEYITRVIERHGFRTVRGSSTRGGIRGLKSLIREARAGHDLALTPDGPRGPAHELKPGALMAAQVTGAPIIPVAAGASAAWHFDSWDRFMVPRPLARITIEYAEPVWIERRADAEERERYAQELTDTLNRLTARVSAPVEDGVYHRSGSRGRSTP